MFTCNFNLSEPDSLNTLEESKQTYLHIFSLQHEFNNICYWFFDVCRKCLREEKKRTNSFTSEYAAQENHPTQHLYKDEYLP